MSTALPRALRNILERESVYDALPTMSKIMTIDSRLKISDAICSLHRYRRSLLCVYDSESSVFTAVFDSTSVVQHYLSLKALYAETSAPSEVNKSSRDSRTPKPTKNIDSSIWDVTIRDWFQHDLIFPHIGMDDNIQTALELLVKFDLPRLFVWDPIRATVFSFITKATIISRIIEKSTIISNDWDLWAVRDCNIGVSPSDLVMIDGDATITQALKLLVDRNWSACPVSDSATHRKYIGLLTIPAFHRLLNRALMEGCEWTPDSTVESVLFLILKQDAAYSPMSVCKYVDGPIIPSNVFIDRLSTDASSGTGARDIPITVPMREIKDPNRDLINYLSTSPAVLAADLTLRQVFAHIALTEDKRIVLLDSSYKVLRFITPAHIARYILGSS